MKCAPIHLANVVSPSTLRRTILTRSPTLHNCNTLLNCSLLMLFFGACCKPKKKQFDWQTFTFDRFLPSLSARRKEKSNDRITWDVSSGLCHGMARSALHTYWHLPHWHVDDFPAGDAVIHPMATTVNTINRNIFPLFLIYFAKIFLHSNFSSIFV